jgi:hypothetical protein
LFRWNFGQGELANWHQAATDNANNEKIKATRIRFINDTRQFCPEAQAYDFNARSTSCQCVNIVALDSKGYRFWVAAGIAHGDGAWSVTCSMSDLKACLQKGQSRSYQSS